MTLRSKRFATVAMPVLSAAMAIPPAFTASPVAAFEMAQASGEEAQAEEEERQRLLLLQQQQVAEEAARAAAEQQAAEEAQRAAAEAQAAAEQQAAEEAQRAAAEQQAAQEAEQQRLLLEQQAAEEAARAAAEQQAAEEAQRAASEAQAAEQQAADEAERAAAEQQAAQEAEQQRLLLEQQAAEEAARAAAEQQAAEDAQRAQEQPAEEILPETTEQPAAGEEQPAVTEEQAPATQEQPATAEQPVTEEQPATAEQPAAGEQPVVGEQPVPQEQPAAGEQQATETPTQPQPVPEIVDTRSEAENLEIAEDPTQTDETVVLPVEGGAAVLDSDKDADNAGGQTAREERRRQREAQRAEDEAVAPPVNDAEAQAVVAVEPAVLQQAITEEGQRLDAAPAFVTPGDTTINNSTITNNVTNNITNVTVEQRIDNRTVLNVGNQIVIRNDDRPRLRRDSEESFYEELPRGRVRETIVRPGGARIVTIYDRYGDIIQRSRIERNGEEYLMVYSPETETERQPFYRDAGYELPPMRLRIPVRDYIIDTSSDPDRDYYDFLAEPPVERVERVYTIDEVKYSARIRDKVRRIDLDTITFASGSAEVPLAQAKTLRKVANAITEVLDKDPGETFLIEGHTDAVGRDQPNLVLSDQRAESVAELLTDVYGIPPENLVTQGYGERYLKVKTQAAEQQNRRVTIRRVTALVRPVAQAN